MIRNRSCSVMPGRSCSITATWVASPMRAASSRQATSSSDSTSRIRQNSSEYSSNTRSGKLSVRAVQWSRDTDRYGVGLMMPTLPRCRPNSLRRSTRIVRVLRAPRTSGKIERVTRSGKRAFRPRIASVGSPSAGKITKLSSSIVPM